MPLEENAPGRVVSNYGRRVLVLDEHGQTHLCIPKGRKLGVVSGDWVTWRPAPNPGDFGVITEVLPRTSTLERPNNRGVTETLAANIDQLLIVVCHKPPIDPFIVDRYTVSAEIMGAECQLIWNKIDIIEAEEEAALANQLEEFKDIGYNVIRTSGKTGEGTQDLLQGLVDKTSILVGQSGVGKSSLLNCLIPGLEQATADISSATGEGRHTTTTAFLHTLDDGGVIIDSPGIRDYSPPPLSQRKIADGFREFRTARPCRFNDCSHLREPDCGVKEAVSEGAISARRYESYKRLSNTMRQLQSRS